MLKSAVSMHARPWPRFGVYVTPDYIYRRVQSVDTVRFDAPVYNIRVADTTAIP
jgi:hypothetical protein